MGAPIRLAEALRAQNMVTLRSASTTVELCQRCRGSGGDYWEWDDLNIERLHEYCECGLGQEMAARYHEQHGEIVAERARRLYAEAMVPPIYQQARIEDFTEPRERATAEAARAAMDEGRSIILMGTVGNGKSHLACALLNRALARGIAGVFVVVPELLDAVRRGYETGDADKIVARAKTIPFLVLDDLGTEKVTPWALERLYVIVNYRYNNRLQMLVTTNKSLDELSDHVGDRIVSRLVGMAEKIVMVGRDRRTEKLARKGR